jgi:hypothetical protein
VTLASARLSQPVTIPLPLEVEALTGKEPSPRIVQLLAGSLLRQGPCSSCTRTTAFCSSSPGPGRKVQSTATSKVVSVTSMGLG